MIQMSRAAKFLFSFLVLAAAPAVPQGSITPVWDIKSIMEQLAAQVRRLQPLLAHAKPEDWKRQGAPDTYVRLLKSTQDGVTYLIGSTDRLAKEPERLTVALEAFFRMQSMETVLNSLQEGIRKYQSPDLANQLSGAMADYANNREKLRQHILDLANVREQEYKVMDEEAQRCRGTLARTQAACPSETPKNTRRVQPK
jgi:hypothetical protein